MDKRQKVFASILIALFIFAFIPIANQAHASTDPYEPVLKEYKDFVKRLSSGEIRNMTDFSKQNYRYVLSDVARCAIVGHPTEGVSIYPEYALADIDNNGEPELIIGGPNINGKNAGYSIGCIFTVDSTGRLIWPVVGSSFMDQEEITIFENGNIEIDATVSANEHYYEFYQINIYRPGVERVESLSVKSGRYILNGTDVNDTTFYNTLSQLESKPIKKLTWESFGTKTSTEEELTLTNHFYDCVSKKQGFESSEYWDYIDGLNVAGTDKSIVIPGLTVTNVSGRPCKNMVPQGICFDGTHYLISAYCFDGTHNSVFYVIDTNGKYLCTIDLGIISHVGALSCNIDKGKLYIADCFAETMASVAITDQIGCVLEMNISDISDACSIHRNTNRDCVSLLRDVGVDLNDTDHVLIRTNYHADYIDCDKDGIWVGTFKNGIPKYGWDLNYMKEFGYDRTLKKEEFPLGFASQGVHVFDENEKYKNNMYVLNSCSIGLIDRSALNVYSVYEDRLSGTNRLFNRELPARLIMPVLSEDLAVVGSNLFTMYESGANEYRKNGVAHIYQNHSFGRATCADIDTLMSAAIQQIRERPRRGVGSISQEKNVFVIDEGKCGENLEYLLYSDGTLNISGTGDMYNYSADDPAPWQARKDMIKEIYVGEGVTSIGEYAFYGCEKAGLFNVSRSVDKDQTIEIRDMSLADCDNLKSADLPEAEYIVSENAFLNDHVEVRTDNNKVAAQFEAAGQSSHVHNWVYQETVAPSCAAFGYDIYSCSCGEEEYGYAVEPTQDHKLKEVKRVKATYASGGEILYECTVCGEQCSKAIKRLTVPGKSISKIVKGKKSMTVKWKKRTKKEKSAIKGYQVRYSTSKKFTKSKTKTKNVRASATKVKIKKLKSKKTYYVQLRTYTKEKGVKYYSKWSKTKKIKIK